MSFELDRFNLCLSVTWTWPFGLLVFQVSSCSSEERLNPSLVARVVFPFFHQLDLPLRNQSGLISEWAEVSVITAHLLFSASVLVFVFWPSKSGLWQAVSWQSQASAGCVSLLIKPLAESFQNSTTALWFCCWSDTAAGNRTAPACLCYKPHSLLDAKLPILSVWDVWNTVIIL